MTQSDSSILHIARQQKSYLRHLSNEFSKPSAERDSTLIAFWEDKANIVEKDLVRSVSGYGDLVRQVSWQEVQQKLSTGSAAIEFVSYQYYTPKPTDSTIYAALVLLPSDTSPHFIPLFEERQLQALLNRPGLSEKLVLKDLYGNSSELRRLLWDPLEPLLRDVKTIYYSPSGLLHRLNPAALLDASNQTLSVRRQWVRVGSTRELVTGRLADRSFASSPEGNSDNTLTAMVYGGITYDMDSLAFSSANPPVLLDSTENPLRKDGAFSYIITEQPSGKASDTRGNPDGTWGALTATEQEADQVSNMLVDAGFRTFKQKGFSASEDQFKQIGANAPSPRILHLATHGFAYSDPKKDPPKGFGDSEPTYKLLDDPMLRSGLVLAGANYYWKNKRPLANREDGVLVAYEVRDLNLRNTELAVLSACQTGLGDIVGSEGVYGLQRAFRIAGVKFLIVSLWEVPDEQTQELMRLFYQNWLEKKESLRDAFNNAQQRLQEKEPNPYMWAGFVLIE
ncbi:MAG: CHAT domain-containing protein [Saprospiraceae bacterium]|nr:CHAT domain-containing protein [Saprospiraceae bacterium]